MTSAWPLGMPTVGATAELSRTVGPHDIERFTDLSGDRNPLHYDQAAAESSRFGEIVVQGGITSAILNAVVAEKLPGPGTVFLSQNWKFTAPAYIGDTITAEAEVLHVHESKPVCQLRMTVRRQSGEVLLGGEAWCYTFDGEAPRN